MSELIIRWTREVIAEQLGLQADGVAPDARLREDLKADSMAVMEFLLQLEEVFDVIFEDEEMAGFSSVQDIVDYIAARS